MLVLSRKANQQILIDGEVEITIISISKSRVRIGISAPPHVQVTRGELEFDFESREKKIDRAPADESLWHSVA